MVIVCREDGSDEGFPGCSTFVTHIIEEFISSDAEDVEGFSKKLSCCLWTSHLCDVSYDCFKLLNLLRQRYYCILQFWSKSRIIILCFSHVRESEKFYKESLTHALNPV